MSSPVSPSEFTLKARWIFPVDTAPVSGGSITISGERIVAVGSGRTASPAIDLGDVAILPGLVNAHAHLEFSNLPAPLGQPGMAFADWIRRVIQFRSNAEKNAEKGSGPICRNGPQGASHKLDLTPFPESDVSRADAIAAGLCEAIVSGTTTLGEIATPPWQAPSGSATAAMTAFHESIGLAGERIDENVRAASQFLERECAAPADFRPALSPHAPYSVHTELLARLVDLSAERRVPLAMHLAESPEELQLLADHTGPLRDLLEELQAWNPAGIRKGSRPLDYLRVLTRAHRALVVHGNYLADDELSLLAAHPNRLALIFCPRTHAFFSHTPHPLVSLLAAGGAAAVGTDSLASNPDLDMWAELRFLARTISELSLPKILELGTLAGARALGLEDEAGSLRPGKYANLAVVPMSGSGAADPYEMLFSADVSVARTMFRGCWVEQQ